jgi:HK97 family phage major capsid protein
VPYNSLISRSDVQALIPEQVSNQMLTSLSTMSAAMSLFRTVRMSTNQVRMPVLAALPIAYFVNGDTGLKQTTEMAWANKFLNVEEIAAIVPIPEAVLEDLNFSVWDNVRPLLEQAIARVLDAAIFFGTNKPSGWPTDIGTAAVAISNMVARGTSNAANGGLVGDISAVLAKVEQSGYDVNGFVAERPFRKHLRQARNVQGDRYAEVTVNEIDGQAIRWAMPGLWPTGSNAIELFAGDWSQAILGIRSDFSWKMLDQAVITDETGAIRYNLPQQDMVAMRVTARFAWQVANTINYQQPTEASRYPFAVLRAPA